MATVEVRSDRNPDVVYEVNTETGECSCPSYTQNLAKKNAEDGGSRRCKHFTRLMEKPQK